MKEITQQEANALQNSHDYFFKEHIRVETAKAFQVEIFNFKKDYCKFWVPKSKVKFLIQPDTRKTLNSAGTQVANPAYGCNRPKYFIPIHFTKPHKSKSK